MEIYPCDMQPIPLNSFTSWREQMNRKLLFFTALVLGCAMVMGCKVQPQLQQSTAAFEAAPFEICPPFAQSIADADVPGDIRMVTAAIVKKLRQDPAGFPGVAFDPAGSHYTPETSFDYQGFSVSTVSIVDHWAKETGNKSFACRLHGVLTFDDALGRRTLLDYVADYELFQNKVVILKSQILPIPPIFPRTQAFFIDAGKFQKILDQRPDFSSFYAQVVTKAHNMTPTPEERKARQARQSMNFVERLKSDAAVQRKDHFLVIFVMDRLTPDAELEVIVSRYLNDVVPLAEPVYKDFQGWRVAIVGGNFAVDRDLFYARAYYKPAPGVLPDGKEQVLVGAFSSEKKYEPAMSVSTGQTTSVSAREGPLGMGREFLNLKKHDDVALIQTRLAELGYYQMNIDGLWGSGSSGALQKFQMASGLQATGKWDLGTQIKLFSGTGK